MHPTHTLLSVYLPACLPACRKSIAKKAGAGFGYGFVVGWCFVMAFFTLMCGLVMQGFTSTVEGKLTEGEVLGGVVGWGVLAGGSTLYCWQFVSQRTTQQQRPRCPACGCIRQCVCAASMASGRQRHLQQDTLHGEQNVSTSRLLPAAFP